MSNLFQGKRQCNVWLAFESFDFLIYLKFTYDLIWCIDNFRTLDSEFREAFPSCWFKTHRELWYSWYLFVLLIHRRLLTQIEKSTYWEKYLQSHVTFPEKIALVVAILL